MDKQFVFENYDQATNFLNRYTDHCQRLNFTPEWSNVYNKVSVRIYNSEFKALTTKEVELGSFLERVSKQTLNQDIDEFMAFERIVDVAKLDTRSVINEQSKPTPLFVSEFAQTKKDVLYLQ